MTVRSGSRIDRHGVCRRVARAEVGDVGARPGRRERDGGRAVPRLHLAGDGVASRRRPRSVRAPLVTYTVVLAAFETIMDGLSAPNWIAGPAAPVATSIGHSEPAPG